jgi:uncharacterized protein with GYD domain
MPTFLMRFTYTPETWRALIANPEDRSEAAREYVEAVGGTMQGFWYSLGADDGYFLFDVPDEVAAAGVVLAITAGGAMSSVETTALLSVHDTLEALDKGHAVKYRKPGVNAPAMSHN